MQIILDEILKKSITKLKKTSPTPRLDAELLLARSLRKTREFILAHPEFKLTKIQNEKFEKLISRRSKFEPIAYILGEKEFYGLNFKVNRDTLIPRPETEMLVEKTLALINDDLESKITLIDLGTGSGNIIISIAKNIKNKLELFGIDISKNALSIAKHNAKKNKVNENIKFIQSDLLNYFLTKDAKLKNKNLIILANLPYVSKKIYDSTSQDIKKYEPKTALISKNNGLAHYEKLLKQIKELENKKYKLKALLEFSPEQKKSLTKLITETLPTSKPTFHKDLAEKWRVAQFEL